MTTQSETKFREGDRVSVEGVVVTIRGPGSDYLPVVVEIAGVIAFDADPSWLKLVEAAPPQPGDTVIHKDNECEAFKVLALDGLSAWVRSEGGHMYQTVLLANLVVVERA
jgi:hypothetical protein